ncbi:phage tail assembly protein, partial [Salmonella enterica subsp. enterica serovar Eko]|nr:phage tail assembly protein [Salmonella enterica subsp. enterica serovar Eko]
REPSYDEIEAIGFPFTVSGDGGVRLDSSVALKYIPVLAGIPRSSAAQLAKLDIFKACMLILNFFTRSETEEDSESESTTPHTSGE